MKSRGWDWEESHVRRVDRVDRMLLVLFLMLWWLFHLGASCIHNGRRDRYDRHDRREKNVFRLGRLYLLDIERRARRSGNTGGLKICRIFQGKPGQWTFSLRFWKSPRKGFTIGKAFYSSKNCQWEKRIQVLWREASGRWQAPCVDTKWLALKKREPKGPFSCNWRENGGKSFWEITESRKDFLPWPIIPHRHKRLERTRPLIKS